MTPPGTMARVYDTLKARIMAGGFSPGERIDPARLSAELSASATPIRDALHRLAGERLVDSWQQEGFRQGLAAIEPPKRLDSYSFDKIGNGSWLRSSPLSRAAGMSRHPAARFLERSKAMKLFGKPKPTDTQVDLDEQAGMAYRLSKVVNRAGAPEPQSPSGVELNPS